MPDLTPARPTTWSQYGVAVFDNHTTAEAIVGAGLDWNVELKPVYQLKSDGTYAALPKQFGVTRDSDERVLGLVRDKYEPFQNVEAFSFFDPLLASGLATLDTADTLYDGRIVWLIAKFLEPIHVGGLESERIDMYALLRTSHDGSKSISIDITPTRLLCSNTLNLAMRRSHQSWKVTHTKALHGRLAEAREMVENLAAYTQEFSATATQLLETKLTLEEFEAFLGDLLPNDSEALRTKVAEHHASTPTLTEEVRATGWGAVNSVGEYFQHCRNFRSGSRALDMDWFGSNQKVRDRAVSLLVSR